MQMLIFQNHVNGYLQLRNVATKTADWRCSISFGVALKQGGYKQISWPDEEKVIVKGCGRVHFEGLTYVDTCKQRFFWETCPLVTRIVVALRFVFAGSFG